MGYRAKRQSETQEAWERKGACSLAPVFLSSNSNLGKRIGSQRRQEVAQKAQSRSFVFTQWRSVHPRIALGEMAR